MTIPLPKELADTQVEIERYARDYGLDFPEIRYIMLDYAQMNEVASYDGFPTRYPHWRFGMEYDRMSKSYAYGLHRIYEMVINNDPVYAYLLVSNAFVDQKLVMAHVCGHADFFKNNLWFAHTNRRMLDEMANHGTRIRRHIERVGFEAVETFLDICLSLDNLIDVNAPGIQRRPTPRRPDDEDERPTVHRLQAKSYMDEYINPPAFIEEQKRKLKAEKEKRKKLPEEPEHDVLLFLLEHAPLENWQHDILSIIREEAYYFAPQRQTKIMNEGWACLRGDMLVFTNAGLITMAELVGGGAAVVSDGERHRRAYDRNIFRNRETITIKTRRGLMLIGSTNHRVLLADGVTWKRLDELAVGERVAVSGGRGLWADHEVTLSWRPPVRVSLEDVAQQVGVSVWTVLRYRAGQPIRRQAAVATALATYDDPVNQRLPQSICARRTVRIPDRVDADLAALIGYLIGDGHISRVKRHFGLTTGDEEQAHAFAALVTRVFGVPAVIKPDGRRYRVLVYAQTASDFLVEAVGLTHGPSARDKKIPDVILRSPEPVVRAFLRAYFDCDGYAGKTGVILSTASDTMAAQVQLLLLNYGILSYRRQNKDGTNHIRVTGASAARFAERIGFGLARKQEALESYVHQRRWFKKERWDDTIVSIEHGWADVYDISVEETHRYAAAGFINHNSYWHSTIMTQRALKPSELIDYADHHSGTMSSSPGRLNPYKIGIELFRDIEERWNKGRFGPDWEACDDIRAKEEWDKKLELGRQKIFEVRKIYNDVGFIDAFLTEDFARRHKLFTYRYDKQTRQYRIDSRDFNDIKRALLFQLTNFGQPVITVEDANYNNRGELYLKHHHEGIDLHTGYAVDTLANLAAIWQRPVHIETVVEGEGRVLFSHDGREPERTRLDN